MEDKSFFQCVKTSLKSVVKDPDVTKKLTDAALRASKIMTHTLQFMKLHIIHCYDNKQNIPTVDKTYITRVMKTLCKKPTRGRPPKEETQVAKAVLEQFYLEHYKDQMCEELNYEHMCTVLDYMAVEVKTMYENNIKQRFVGYIERYVNVLLDLQGEIEAINGSENTVEEKKKRRASLRRELKKVKNDILCKNNPKKSAQQYHEWIDEHSVNIMPQEELTNGVYYDLVVNPQSYLPLMLYMMKCIEASGNSIHAVFPLRSAIIPKNCRIDTTTLVYLLYTNEHGKRTHSTLGGKLKETQSDIWSQFFKTEKKIFHRKEENHGYTFHHMIETDGVSCSIILIRKDKRGKIVKKPKAKQNGGEKYIDEITDEERTELSDLNLIAIDPNMGDLLYCVNSSEKSQTKFRYSQNMRRKETKVKKYRDLLLEWKKEEIDGRKVADWETDMSAYNQKTLNFEAFKDYIGHKNKLNFKLQEFYTHYIFKKLKLGSYIRRQITEARMLKRFEKLFGPPDKVVICIGDWEQRQHRKFSEPVKGKGFRTLFRKAKYKVFLVDEYRTSCRCSACSRKDGVCSTFRMVKNPKPKTKGRIECHGLVKCKTCSRLWNRDINSSSNIHKIAKNAILGLERPDYLKRGAH